MDGSYGEQVEVSSASTLTHRCTHVLMNMYTHVSSYKEKTVQGRVYTLQGCRRDTM